ncbi:MAG: M48 family metalloprotease [Pseudanabaenaceae cyanobacterium bins.68]|nr:M48 family metalloprotease [Pseudanabaenaceae cyanobacterium bins.68]
MSLQAAKQALLAHNYTEAIALLQSYCQDHPQPHSENFHQAQMWLVNAYQRTGRTDRAIAVCEELLGLNDLALQQWAATTLTNLQLELEGAPASNHHHSEVVKSQPNRYRKGNVHLTLPGIKGLAYGLGAVLAIATQIGWSAIFWFWLVSHLNPTLVITTGWQIVALVLTLGSNLLLFFMSPWIIDQVQSQVLRLNWINLNDLENYSGEAVELIEQFCQQRQYHIPQIALVEDPSAIAYTYGVLPNSSRLVLSRGLLELLDPEEIAAVVGAQLGQIASWSFAIATYGSGLAQLLYGLQTWLVRLSLRIKRGKLACKVLAKVVERLRDVALIPVGLATRPSAPIYDQFGAAVTGNPNAIARAFTKIARATLGQTENRVLAFSRSLAVIDYETLNPTGIAFEILHGGQADPDFRTNLYGVFLWEMFNPWAKWLACGSTHPLLGDRLRGLTRFCKQLGLTTEYEFDQLIKQGESLNRRKLYKNFLIDLMVETAPYTLAGAGYITSQYLYWLYDNWLPLALTGVGAGIGIMWRGSFRYPNYNRVAATTLANLLVDPYASTLRGQPVQIPGEILGYLHGQPQRGSLSYGIKLGDQSGLIYLDYLPNLKTLCTEPQVAIRKLETLVGKAVVVTGWFRRDRLATIDLAELKPISSQIKTMPSYHQFWNNLASAILVFSGLGLLVVSNLG